MPIYAYRCTACGHAKDVLQKLSDPLLTTCPQCGAEAFTKQVTAAGFQLKGSGWYVTDFKGGSQPAAKPPAEGAAAESQSTAKDGGEKKETTAPSLEAGAKAGSATAAPAATPAATTNTATPPPTAPAGKGN